MIINVTIKDSKGNDLNIGDTVSVYNWHTKRPRDLLYVGVVEFDKDEMQLEIQPKDGYFDIDQYDLWLKAYKIKEEL
jgi:hypothetical protein